MIKLEVQSQADQDGNYSTWIQKHPVESIVNGCESKGDAVELVSKLVMKFGMDVLVQPADSGSRDAVRGTGNEHGEREFLVRIAPSAVPPGDEDLEWRLDVPTGDVPTGYRCSFILSGSSDPLPGSIIL